MKNINRILKEIRPEFDFKNCEDFFLAGMIDSLDLITLIASLDQTYGISIEGTDIIPENFKNINAIENMLKKYKVKI